MKANFATLWEKSDLVKKKKQLYDGVAFSPPIHALSRVHIVYVIVKV